MAGTRPCLRPRVAPSPGLELACAMAGSTEETRRGSPVASAHAVASAPDDTRRAPDGDEWWLSIRRGDGSSRGGEVAASTGAWDELR